MDINYENLADLHRTISTSFQNAFAAAPPSQWAQVAELIRSTSDRNDYHWLGEMEDMREWLGQRIARELKSYEYSIKNREFELTLKAKRTEIEDDAGGAVALYSSRAQIMARSVARHPDQFMFGEVIARGHELIGYDGVPFFDTDHPVGSATVSNHMGGAGTPWYLLDTTQPLKPFIFQMRKEPEFVAKTNLTDDNVFFDKTFLWGVDARYAGGFALWHTAVKSKQTLSLANLDTAIDAMAAFTNDEGVKMGLRPNILLYPDNLRATVRDLFEPEFLANGASNLARATKNDYGLILIQSSWLPSADPA